MHTQCLSRTPTLAALALLATLSWTPEASACGGLFCSTSNPVSQVAERIIFSMNDDDTVTAAIEIQYEGPADQFAWLLPVPPGNVEVGVSSQQALDALQAQSNPIYSLQTTFESCDAEFGIGQGQSTSGAAPGGAAAADRNGAGAITVLASGAAGPYDFVLIEVNDSLSNRAEVAVEWLTENEYDVTDFGSDVLGGYLEQDMNLLAFRLNKDNDSGSIRPVLITYEAETPMIPIQPTAVAALDDMGIMVWVLGDSRAIPTNYLSLELNEVHINWFNPNPTYNEVVIEAADEAGGWGFVTEQSGPASQFTESIYPSYKEDQWDNLRTGQFSSMEQFLQQAIGFAQAPFVNNFGGGFGGAPVAIDASGVELYDGFLDLLNEAETVPLREGATGSQLASCVSCYFQQDVPVRNDAYPPTPYVPGEDPIDSMDVPAFLDRMEQLVVAPLEQTRALFEEQSQVTRLYTTLSPDEMTVDPAFDLNPDLEDVDNVHTAERLMGCDGNTWTITLPQGHVIEGSGNDWPISASDSDEVPFNLRTLQFGQTGEGEVVNDNYEDIASALIDLGIGNVDPESPAAKESNLDGTSNSGGSGGGCSVAASKSNAFVMMALTSSVWLLGAAFARRRQSRRTRR